MPTIVSRAQAALHCPNCGSAVEKILGDVTRYEDDRRDLVYSCGASINYTQAGEFFERVAPCPNRQQPDPMSAKQPLELGTPSISG